MLKYLESLDIELFKAINGLHNSFFDGFMWLVSDRFTWMLICVMLLYVIFKKNWKQGVVILFVLALTITLCDQISSTVIKHAVERLRPTHTESLSNSVHIVNNYTGGLYGFVSSHAANSFGAAMLLSLIIRNRFFSIMIFTWAAILSYSRVYLGVHYPGDILGGICVGLLMGYICYMLYGKIISSRRLSGSGDLCFSCKEANVISYSIIINILILTFIGGAVCFTT